MKTVRLLLEICLLLGCAAPAARAHHLGGEAEYDFSVPPPLRLPAAVIRVAQATRPVPVAAPTALPKAAAAFQAFAPKVHVRADEIGRAHV